MEKNKRYSTLAEFAKELLTKKSVADGLPHISKYIKEISGADRCSIFVHDAKNNELWTTLADGLEKLIVPANQGIVGYTMDIKEPIIENSPYKNPYFLHNIDTKTGYTTTNLATVPIFNSKKKIIGVLQLLNKEGGFKDSDVKFMDFFSSYISDFIELVTLYDDKP